METIIGVSFLAVVAIGMLIALFKLSSETKDEETIVDAYDRQLYSERLQELETLVESRLGAYDEIEQARLDCLIEEKRAALRYFLLGYGWH